MNFRNIGAGGQANAASVVMPGFLIILGKPFADLAGCSPDNRVLIGIVVGFAVEYIHSESALFEAIQAAIERGGYDMPQKATTFFTGAKLRAFENFLQRRVNRRPGKIRPGVQNTGVRPWRAV